MPTIIDNKVVFQGGEALPNVGSEAFKQAQAGIIPDIANAPITSASLTPQTPINITPPAPSTALQGLGASIESGITADISNAKEAEVTRLKQQELAVKQSAVETSQQTLTDKLLGRNKTALIAEESARVNELGTTVNQTADAVKKANQEILNEQFANRRRQEVILNNGNITRGQAQTQIQEIDRLSISTQADLYIKKLALQGDYDSAKNIADQFINAKYEQQQNEIDAANLSFTNNKELFTKAEERQYQEVWQGKQNELLKKKEDDKSTFELKIKLLEAARETGQTSLASQISSAKNKEEMLRLSSQLLPSPATQKIQRELAGGGIGKTPDVQNFGTSDNPVWRQYNPSTKVWDNVSGLTTTPISNALGNALASNKIENITNVLNNASLGSVVGPSSLAKTNPGLWGAAKRFISGALAGGVTGAVAGLPFGGVGAIPGAIIGALTVGTVNSLRGTKDELTGDRATFIGSVEQIRSELTVAKLAQAKGQGVTFGALSDGERGLIANAATKIGTWAVHEDGDREKPVLGYAVNEKDFKREMDIINYFTKLDAILKGSTLESVGAITQPDGTIWVVNSDGTLSQIDLTNNRQ